MPAKIPIDFLIALTGEANLEEFASMNRLTVTGDASDCDKNGVTISLGDDVDRDLGVVVEAKDNQLICYVWTESSGMAGPEIIVMVEDLAAFRKEQANGR